MNNIARIICLILLGLATGCGGGPPSLSDSGSPPPHEGQLVRMPGGKGYVEIVQKKAASPTAPMTAEVSFYVLQEDGKTPASPAPTAGTLDLGKKKVALKPEGDALVTPSGPPLFARSGGVDGILNIERDGATARIPLGLR